MAYAAEGLGIKLKLLLMANSTLTTACRVCTLNCEGFTRNSVYVNDLLNRDIPAILCIQETWLLHEQADRIRSLHTDYLSIAKSGVETSAHILTGRPYGGVAIMYRKGISRSVTQLTIDSNRVCAIHVRGADNVDILVLCIYMPCDKMLINECNIDYENTLNQIDVLIQSHPHSNVIICGDFNTSFERHNAQTRCLNNFVLRNNLRVAWESSKSQKAPTYVNYNLGHSSCIDHFAVSTDIYDSIVTNYVESDPTNFSSHNVVILEFEYQVETDRYAYVDETEEKHCKWSKATADDICKYRHVLDSILEQMVLPTDMLRCENVHCNNRAQTESIDTMCSDIMERGSSVVECRTRNRVSPGSNPPLLPFRRLGIFVLSIVVPVDSAV